MTDDKLKQSLKPGGPHHLLASMIGKWKGEARTWFEPGKLADASKISVSLKAVLEGRFVVLSYKGSLLKQPMLGQALIGFNLTDQKFSLAWTDSCHYGTAIMLSTGDRKPAKNSFSVLGSYPDGKGGPNWGWRSEFTITGKNALAIRYFNIMPNTAEALAVEMLLKRA